MDRNREIKCCILLLLDGLGDRSFHSLGGMTPLQAAHTPNLDRIAALGANGMFHASSPGLALPSEEAHFLMFGYSPKEFPGRGYLEALGAGLELSDTDVAILAHFVSVREKDGVLILEKDRPKAKEEEIDALLQSIFPVNTLGLTVTFHHTKALDGLIKITGDASPHITDTDPLMEAMPIIEVEPLGNAPSSKKARSTAKALKAFQLAIYAALKEHPLNQKRVQQGKPPINFIATNRPGQRTEVQSFKDKWGLSAASISSGLVYKGLSRFLGLDHLLPQPHSNVSRDITSKMKLALELSDDYDFIHVHTKAPDEAAHTKDPQMKKEAIEALDRGLKEAFQEVISREDILLVVASDHSTPSGGPLIHSGEPVPITAYGKNIRRDTVERFSEIHGAQGSIGQIRGKELMYVILNWMDRAKLRGLMDTPWDQPFLPGMRKGFSLRGES